MALLPGPWNLQSELLAPCASQIRRLCLELGVSGCLSLTSPLVTHWLICHLPVADQSPSVLLLPVHPPASSLFCRHAVCTAALLWYPLCSERSIFCVFLVVRYPTRLLPSVEPCSPSVGRAPFQQTLRIPAASGILSFCPDLVCIS